MADEAVVPHPYTTASKRAFWSKAVAESYAPAEVFMAGRRLIGAGQRVVSAGSCFAAHLIPFLEAAGLTYLRTETRPLALQAAPAENFGYETFSAAYGNIYTARQLLQLLRRSVGRFAPKEDRWLTPDTVIDPFRPGLRYAATSEREFDLLTAQHLAATRAAFERADVFIFTLGLTEAWISRADGAVFPACPGTIAGQFDPARHAFANFTVAEVAGDLDAFIGELRSINRNASVILTVSPVPLVATATTGHVLTATTYSKSVLRAAAEEAVTQHADVLYFPAYEIVNGPQAPKNYFEPDRRNVSDKGIAAVMNAFLAHCERPASVGTRKKLSARLQAITGSVARRGRSLLARNASRRHAAAKGSKDAEAAKIALARRISAAECEEAMVDPS